MPTVTSTDSGYRYWTDARQTIRLEFQGTPGQWNCNLCGHTVTEGKDFDQQGEAHAASHR